VFTLFFTTKPAETGTGLGLPIVHGIVTAMGGDIQLKTEVGEGTVFTIRLPRAESRQISLRSAAPPKLRGRILLVEDDAEVRLMMKLYLNKEGWLVDEVENGMAALEALPKKQYGALITDIQLPTTTALISEVRARFGAKTPIIAITTGIEQLPADRLRLLQQGTTFFLRKPFAVEELSQALNKL
jgi:CheY-like chemotaxis protein